MYITTLLSRHRVKYVSVKLIIKNKIPLTVKKNLWVAGTPQHQTAPKIRGPVITCDSDPSSIPVGSMVYLYAAVVPDSCSALVLYVIVKLTCLQLLYRTTKFVLNQWHGRESKYQHMHNTTGPK